MVDDAYQQLRKLILSGELAANERLSQRALAKKLGMSTMPIVEALRRLEQDGLVGRLPQYGAYVREWTPADIEETFLIRRALEGEAARQMALRATPEEKQTLLELAERVDADMGGDDPGTRVELELAFHLHLARCSRLPKLYQLLETAHILLRSLYMWPGRLQVPLREMAVHRPIAQAIAAGDAEAAQKAMFVHIDNAIDSLREHAAQSGATSQLRALTDSRAAMAAQETDSLQTARAWLKAVG
jgi:DNA-binding GntR family transcriptional regulator